VVGALLHSFAVSTMLRLAHVATEERMKDQQDELLRIITEEKKRELLISPIYKP
jgi:hypothetical protein